ncbi:MAG: PKD domain-containing protein [Thermoplasmatota archaeon]
MQHFQILPIKRPSRASHADAAVSEVLGTVLLTLTTVVLLGGFGIVVLQTMSTGSVPPSASFALATTPGARAIDVSFVSGTSFSTASATFALGVNGTSALSDAYLVSPSTAGIFSPGGKLHVNLTSGAPPIGPGTRLLFIATDHASSKPIGLTTLSLLTAATTPTYLANAPSITSVSISPNVVVADGAHITNLSAVVASTYGQRLLASVTANLTAVGGPPEAILHDDGLGGDKVAGDGNYTLQFAPGVRTFPTGVSSILVSIPVQAKDAFGHTSPAAASTTVTLALIPATNADSLATNKLGLGAVSRNLPSSATLGSLGVTNWTWRNVMALTDNAIVFRVSDLKDYTRTWVVEIDFTSACSDVARNFGGIKSVIFTRDSIPGGSATFAPTPPPGKAAACFQTGATSYLNLETPTSSVNATGVIQPWNATLVIPASQNVANFSYTAAGIGPLNEGVVTFSGITTPTANPHIVLTQIGIGTADLTWTLATTPTAVFSTSGSVMTVNVDATGSSDPTGQLLTYSWNWGDSSPLGSGVTASHTYATAGVYTITLTATNTAGLQGTTFHAFTADHSPVAGFTVNTAALIASVDSSGTTDADAGQALTYTWNWGDGSSYGPIANTTATHKFACAGTYTITLTVHDPLGGVGSVAHAASPNVAPTAAWTFTTSLLTVNVDASTSSDTDCDPLTYTWTWNDGTAATAGVTAAHTFSTAGNHNVKLTVSDPLGAATSLVKVVTVDRPPVAVFTSAPAGWTVKAYAINSTDPDAGQTLTYAWNWGDGQTTAASSATSATHQYQSAGTRTITLTVTDNMTVSATTSTAVLTDGATWWSCAPGQPNAVVGTVTGACSAAALRGADADAGASISLTEPNGGKKLDVEFTGEGYSEANRTHTLSARATAPGGGNGEPLYLQVGTTVGGTTTWTTLITWSAGTTSTQSLLLTATQWNGGQPLVRFADNGTLGLADTNTANTFSVDWLKVVTS